MALTQLKTSGIADDAVTTAKLAAGTDGQIITYDASGNPTAVGPGTDGQVLTSTGAGSPPAFETISIPAGTTINNNADNRVITGSGTANTLNGESGLTFDGNTINFTSGSGDARLTLIGTEGNDARISLVADDGDDHIDQYNIRSNADDNSFSIDQFESGSFVERFTIANGGHVGIGDTSPAELLTLRDATPRIRLEDSDTTNAACQFVGDNANVLIQADTAGVVNDSNISFAVDGGERMRIDSSGRLGVATTSPHSYAIATFNDSNGISLTGSTQTRIVMQHANGGTNLKNFDIQTSDGNLRFRTIGDNNTTVTERLRIQSGGGISFNGDTAADNALDDYEEGLYNPTLSGSSSTTDLSMYSNDDTLSYIKIGTQCWVYGRIRLNNVNFAGGLRMTLPFAAASGTEASNAGQSAVATHGVEFSPYSSTQCGLWIETYPGTSYGVFVINRDDDGWTTAGSSQIKQNSYLAIQHLYKTT